MTTAEASQFGWDVATSLIGFVSVIGVALLVFALLKDLSR